MLIKTLFLSVFLELFHPREENYKCLHATCIINLKTLRQLKDHLENDHCRYECLTHILFIHKFFLTTATVFSLFSTCLDLLGNKSSQYTFKKTNKGTGTKLFFSIHFCYEFKQRWSPAQRKLSLRG